MPRIHNYAVSVTWTGNRGTGTSGYRAYDRDHDVAADGRPVIVAVGPMAARRRLHARAALWINHAQRSASDAKAAGAAAPRVRA
jgi:hypothetical protein